MSSDSECTVLVHRYTRMYIRVRSSHSNFNAVLCTLEYLVLYLVHATREPTRTAVLYAGNHTQVQSRIRMQKSSESAMYLGTVYCLFLRNRGDWRSLICWFRRTNIRCWKDWTAECRAGVWPPSISPMGMGIGNTRMYEFARVAGSLRLYGYPRILRVSNGSILQSSDWDEYKSLEN